MISNTVTVKGTPVFLIVDDRKIQLDKATISIERRGADGTLQINGIGTDLSQLNDLAVYLESILSPPP
jgi:hypothetical protein